MGKTEHRAAQVLACRSLGLETAADLIEADGEFEKFICENEGLVKMRLRIEALEAALRKLLGHADESDPDWDARKYKQAIDRARALLTQTEADDEGIEGSDR